MSLKKSTIVRTAFALKYKFAGALTRWHPRAGTGLLLSYALKPERRGSPDLLPEQLPDWQEWMNFEGHRVALYRWLGTGPTIFVGHGWSSSAFRLIALIQLLRDAGYGVVACDHLGHGRSSGHRANLPRFARLSQRIIETQGPIAAAVGHSLGGAALAVSRSLNAWELPIVLLAAPAEPRVWFQQIRDKLGLSSHSYEEMIATLEREEGLTFDKFTPETTMAAVKSPTLVVHGEADEVISIADGRRYLIGDSVDWLELPGVGHSKVARHPQTFERLLTWLEEVL